MGQMTVMSGPERRRRWSDEQKVSLVEAAFAPDSSVAEIARQADIGTSLLYRWRQSFRREAGFVPVLLDEPAVKSKLAEPALVVEFSGGQRVLIGAGASPTLVTAALRALR